MDKPISISGYKRFMQCPKYYQFYDVDKDRPNGKASPLVVGTIMDTVVNAVLLKSTQDPYELLKTELLTLGQITDYMDDDFDQDFVDLPSLSKKAKDLGWKGKNIVDTVKSFLKEQSSLSPNQQIILNMACNDTLSKKCHLMLDGFMQWIYPQIVEVYEVQKHIVSKDGKIHGYSDFTCKLKNGLKVLADLKTSKMPYAKDAVEKSPQLALYADIEDYTHAAFIVLSKTINKQKVKTCKPCSVKITGGNAKKCPKCSEIMDVDMSPKSYAQLLVAEIPKETKNLTTEAINDTIKCIDNGVFPRNLTTCFYMFGKECPYVKKCWKGLKK